MRTRSSEAPPAVIVFGVALWVLAGPVAAQSPPAVSVQLSNGGIQLTLSGEVGSACTIQYRSSLFETDFWQFMTNLLPLPGSPYLIADASATTNMRFYRAMSQQLPANVVTTNMIWIAPGTFVMGSPPDEALRFTDETQHTVTFTRGFYIGKFEVTQGEYLALIGSNPSYFTTNDWFRRPIAPDLNRPVEQVTWFEATNYCWRLTQQEQAGGRLPAGWVYRLPTESEWEYACRAGTKTAFHFGRTLRSGMANVNGAYEYDASAGDIYNPGGTYLACTTAVGSYPPNAWGLHDMHGNVYEWCQDWYGAYPAGSVTDPQGPSWGYAHIIRGGAWFCGGNWYCGGGRCRAARRDAFDPAPAGFGTGLRIVLAEGQQ